MLIKDKNREQLTKKHIKKLVIDFYQRVREDNLLGPIFNDIAKVDWEHHIPLICQFWNSVMLKEHEYKGNAFMKHVLLSKQTEIREVHFSRWLQLFQEEAQKHLPLQAAQEIMQRAFAIADSLKYGMKV